MNILPNRKQWSKWTLPNKLTAIGTFIALISLVLYLADSFSLYQKLNISNPKSTSFDISKIALKIFNNTDSTVSIFSRNEFILWLPQGVNDGAPNIAGKLELQYVNVDDSLIEQIEVKSHDSLLVLGKILNEKYFYRFLEAEDCDLDIMIRKTNGEFLNNYTIPFTRKALNSGYLPIVIF